MDEKDKQLYETTLVVESAKQTAELGKDVASDIVRPTSKSIGENIGYLVDGTLGWLGVWGQKQKIKQEKYIEDYKKEINKNIENIPKNCLKEPTMYIVGLAIEASKYYYEETQFKEMFAKLIASSCDNRCKNKITPFFVEAIKQISSQDAAILSLFKIANILSIANLNLKSKSGGSVHYKNYLFYNDSICGNNYGSSLINLQRLGFINIDFQQSFTDKKRYLAYEQDEFYIKIKHEIANNVNNPSYEFNEIQIEQGIVEITPLGRNFLDLCL